MKTRIAALTLLALAACSAEPETGPPPSDDVAVEEPLPEATPEPLPEPEPLPTLTPDPLPTEAPTPVPLDEQMQDDADATGMTARVNRDEDPQAEEPVPVEE